jgi:cytochrome c oxidase subunit 4
MEESGAAERAPQVKAAATRTYVAAWVSLLILLALTVLVAWLDVASVGVAVNLLIATAKAGLVLVFFMHLPAEGRFLKIMLGVTLGALTLIILLTFSDVLFRR